MLIIDPPCLHARRNGFLDLSEMVRWLCWSNGDDPGQAGLKPTQVMSWLLPLPASAISVTMLFMSPAWRAIVNQAAASPTTIQRW